MAVQIPTLQRVGLPEPTPSGRLNVQAPDRSRATRIVSEGVSGVLQAGLEFATRVEDETAQTNRNRGNIEYSNWWNEKINGKSKTDTEPGVLGLRHKQGDPNELYNDFDKEALEKRDEILAKYSDGSARSRSIVEAGINKTFNSLHNNRLAIYGNQHAQYEVRVTKATTDNLINAAPDAMLHVVANEESTLKPFMDLLDDIQQTQLESSSKLGTAVKLKDGNFKTAPSAKRNVAKHKSKAVFGAIDALISTDQVDKANYMMDKFGDQLDNIHKPKLDKKLHEAKVRVQGFQDVGKLDGKTFKQKVAKLNEIKDPERRAKARALNDTMERQKQNSLTRRSNRAYVSLYNYVDTRMRGENPFVTVDQLNDDEDYQKLSGQMDSVPHLKAIDAMVGGGPKESNTEALIDSLDLKGNVPRMLSMPAADIVKKYRGRLSDKHFNGVMTAWAITHKETNSQVRSRTGDYQKVLKEELRRVGLYPPKGKKIRKSHTETLEELSTRITEANDSFANMNRDDFTKYLRPIVRDEALAQSREKGGIFSRLFGEDTEVERKPIEGFYRSGGASHEPPRRDDLGSDLDNLNRTVVPERSRVKGSPNGPGKFDARSLTFTEQRRLRKQFRIEKNRNPNSNEEFEAWVIEKRGIKNGK